MPTVVIPNKICSHCGGNTWAVHNEKRPTIEDPNRIYTRYRCLELTKARKKRWNKLNEDSIREYTRQRDIKRRAEGYWTTPKMQAYFRSREQHYRDVITDKYIRYLWRKNPEHKHHTLTQEELNIYRTYLITHRKVKQLEHGN